MWSPEAWSLRQTVLDANQYRSTNQRMIDWFLNPESETAHNLLI